MLIKVQEAHRIPNRTRKETTHHVIIKRLNVHNKEKSLKGTREKNEVTYKSRTIRMASNFSMATLKARKGWAGILQVMKD